MELRRLLRRPDTRILSRKLLICGKTQWGYHLIDGVKHFSNITVYIDPRRDGLVRLVIHELLHIYMSNHLDVDLMTYEVEEAAILAWEHLLYTYLHDPKRVTQLDAWARAIERKLNRGVP